MPGIVVVHLLNYLQMLAETRRPFRPRIASTRRVPVQLPVTERIRACCIHGASNACAKTRSVDLQVLPIVTEDASSASLIRMVETPQLGHRTWLAHPGAVRDTRIIRGAWSRFLQLF
jgi:hypothetical protein